MLQRLLRRRTDRSSQCWHSPWRCSCFHRTPWMLTLSLELVLFLLTTVIALAVELFLCSLLRLLQIIVISPHICLVVVIVTEMLIRTAALAVIFIIIYYNCVVLFLVVLEELWKRPLNILLLGETGVGKSTWIIGFENYCKHSTLEDEQRNGMTCKEMAWRA